MASLTQSQNSSAMTPGASAPTPTSLPEVSGFDLEKYRKSEDARKLVAWVKSEWSRAKAARSRKQLQWFYNLSMFYGEQWVELMGRGAPAQFRDQMVVPRRPYYKKRRTINRTRSYVRWELSKFLGQTPSAVAVPASAEDNDIRAAYAAEQVWNSIRTSRHYSRHFARAAWWMVLTGTGFIKTEWDKNCVYDRKTGERGDVKFSSITPFHLFVPDMREQEIEDQPFIINAYTRPVAWCEYYFGDKLAGYKLTPSVSSANEIVDESKLNIGGAGRALDSVVVYETWVKPGATKLMPEGGLIITVDDILIDIYLEGLPYDHNQYPIAKLEHIPSSTFYADSPIVDLIPLQKEYNTVRSDLSEAANRMGKPQLLAARGSVDPSKMTNEPGQVILYNPGLPKPEPMQLSPIPQYVVEQQDRILADWEDISGEKEVTRGSAPTGVTAGTAINYLQEAANSYLTPQFQSIEQATEKVATQAVELFVQYVDLPRKIKTVGTDGAFDTIRLMGSDIKNATDIRIEPGSSIGQSKAAMEARAMDLYSLGAIDQPQLMQMMEMGGMQRIQDTAKAAERKAQRENLRMKELDPQAILQARQEFQLEAAPRLAEMMRAEGMEPSIEEIAQAVQELEAPPMIPADDFDMHQLHIDLHDRFRMSQEYDILPEEVKQQFEAHIEMHRGFLQHEQMEAMLQQFNMGAGGEMMPPEAGMSEEMMPPGDTMSANGAVPEPPMTGGI